MNPRRPSHSVARAMLISALSIGACGTAVPASAQGLFEALFGSFRQVERALPERLPDPFSGMRRPFEPRTERTRGENGPSRAYCVRTCDGHYFPVHAQPGMNVAQACNSFCPASETKLYYGSSIDHATGNDGTPYSALPNAYAYRKALVSGCTCNGKTAFGLTKIDPLRDPTLRKGDVLATSNGLMAFTGDADTHAQFTPADSYRGLPKSERDKLSSLGIAPAPESAAVNVEPVDNRRAQLDGER